MKTKEIQFSIQGIATLSQYANIRPSYGETLVIEDGDDVGRIRADLRRRVKKVVELEVAEAKRDYDAEQAAAKRRVK